MSGFEVFARVRRLGEIGWIIGRYGVVYGVQGGRLRLSSFAPQSGRVLTDLLEALGPAFVKVGQVLSTRPDVLPPDLTGALARLCDRVKPFDGVLLPQIFLREFGRPIEDVFSHVDLQPVASGSIAQVHRAVLRDSGRIVALKVRRPGITSILEQDLAIFEDAARLANMHPGLRDLPVAAMADEVCAAIRTQVDFRTEAENGRRLREIFADQPCVVVPELIEKLCSTRILTMDFIDGLMPLGESTRKGRLAVEVGLHALYRMIFTHGFIHCDLHPGNIFTEPSGKVVILDMGLVAVLGNEELSDFRDFFWGMVFNEGKTCARVLQKTACFRSSNFDANAFEAEVVHLVERAAALNAGDFHVLQFATELFDVQRRSGLAGSPKFTMAILSLLVYEGITRRACPDLDFQKEAVPYFSTRVLRRISNGLV